MLNSRQKTFVEQYVQTGNATKAAQASGYSTKTAYSIGQRLLKHVEVRQAIEAAQHKAQAQAGITTDMIIRALGRLAFADVDEPVRRSHQLRALQVLLQHVSVEDLAVRVAALEALMPAQPSFNPRRNGHAAHVG